MWTIFRLGVFAFGVVIFATNAGAAENKIYKELGSDLFVLRHYAPSFAAESARCGVIVEKTVREEYRMLIRRAYNAKDVAFLLDAYDMDCKLSGCGHTSSAQYCKAGDLAQEADQWSAAKLRVLDDLIRLGK